MQLGVKEAAGLLNVSEKTIYRWIKQNCLPAFKINDQYRFSRAELLEWATSRRINLSTDVFCEPNIRRDNIPGLAEALKSGGVHYRVCGKDKVSILASTIEVMPLPEEVDKDFLLRVLMVRESLGTTAVGDGIAIPHVRNPIVMHVTKPMISLCFLENPIEFGALDGKPVHTLFTIVSPTVTAHLSLLGRLAFALRQEDFIKVILNRGTREEILQVATRFDMEHPGRPTVADRDGIAQP